MYIALAILWPLAQTYAYQSSNVGGYGEPSLPCKTETVYSTTETYPLNPRVSTCSPTITVREPWTHTKYTGSVTTPNECATQTLKLYGDLYTPGELFSTPVRPACGCSGTTTITVPGSVATGTTASTLSTFTDYTTCYTTVHEGRPSRTIQNVLCAPSNLVTQINGHGLKSPVVDWEGGAKVVNTEATDYSDCCQKCLDTPDCAGTYMATYTYCNLAFSPSNATCTVAMTYSDTEAFDNDFTASGQGYVVQSGCGAVAPIIYYDNLAEPDC